MSLFSQGVGDLHRYTCPQEHHSVQSVREAGSEQRPSTMGRCLHCSVCPDVPHRHRHRHQCDRGSAKSRSANPGGPGGARCWNVHLHHLPGDPPTRAQLSREAASQSALHPAGLHHHDSADISGLRSVRMACQDTYCSSYRSVDDFCTEDKLSLLARTDGLLHPALEFLMSQRTNISILLHQICFMSYRGGRWLIHVYVVYF